MANSFTKVTLGSAQTVGFTTPNYIASSHLQVSVNNVTVPATQGEATQTTFGSFTSTNPLYYILVEGSTSLSFSEEIPAGAVVLITRNSSQSTKLVTYSDSGLLTSDVLNEDSNQAFFIAQEALDQSASNFDSSFEASQGVTVTKVAGIEAGADVTDTENVVAALTAGANITIASNGTIAATDTNTTYTGGTGLTLAGTTFNVDAAQTQITSVGTLSGLTTGATTVNGSLVVNNNFAEIVSTDAGTIERPVLSLYRNSASPANNDYIGGLRFFGNNNASTPEKVYYGSILARAQTVTDGSHRGQIWFSLADGSGGTDGITDPSADIVGEETPIIKLSTSGLSMGSANHLTLTNSSGTDSQLNFNTFSGHHVRVTAPEATITAERAVTFQDASGVIALTNSSTAFTAGDTTVNGALQISSTDTNPDIVITNSENSSADASPIIELHRSQSAGADGEDLGKIEFHGSNDRGFSSGGPEKILYGSLSVEISDASDGTEDGSLRYSRVVNGVQETGTLVLQPDNGGIQFPNLNTAPTNPQNGHVYYDVPAHKLKIYENGAWVNV